MDLKLQRRPIVVAIARPNGAGKSTFFTAHLASIGLPFINADVLALERGIGAYAAAEEAEQMRQDRIACRDSFVFETVLSDPHGSKVDFLRQTAETGYAVVLYFIGLDSALKSDRRVSGRVLQGGHDVPPEKLAARYPRSLDNLARALKILPCVRIYDNSNSAHPFRFVAEYRNSIRVRSSDETPAWFSELTNR